MPNDYQYLGVQILQNKDGIVMAQLTQFICQIYWPYKWATTFSPQFTMADECQISQPENRRFKMGDFMMLLEYI